ncbi:hypothetical protein KEM52_001498, partial [Ascosphaera acerosa]
YQATVDDDSDSESSLSVVTSNSSVDVSAEVAEELHELSQQQIEPAPAPKLKPKPRPNCSRNGNSAATTSSTSKPTKQVPVNGDSISAVKSVKPHRPGTPPYADILGRAVSPFHDEDEYATEVPHPARLIDLEPCTGDVERADTSHVRTGSLANTKPPNTTANVYITTWIPRPDPAVEPDLGPVEVECNEAGHLLSEHDEAMRTPTPDPERWTIPEPQRPPTPHPIFTTMNDDELASDSDPDSDSDSDSDSAAEELTIFSSSDSGSCFTATGRLLRCFFSARDGDVVAVEAGIVLLCWGPVIMDALQEQLQDLFEGQIDFEGQRLAESISTVLLYLSGALSFVAGYIRQDVFVTLWTFLAGSTLAMLVTVPPWPIFNKHPVQWLLPDGRPVAEGQGKSAPPQSSQQIVYEDGKVRVI